MRCWKGLCREQHGVQYLAHRKLNNISCSARSLSGSITVGTENVTISPRLGNGDRCGLELNLNGFWVEYAGVESHPMKMTCDPKTTYREIDFCGL